VPNLVASDAADGFTEEDNLEIKRVGEPLDEGTDHATLGERLGIIDTARAAKVSGSRFGYLKGKGAMLEFSLVRWAMDHLVAEGFTPMVPPVLVREDALVGTGFFPEAREQVYEIPRDELFLVGTAEVPLAAYHTGEILSPDEIPLRYAGFSTCFRREAGTYGKDTAGIFRVHQFDKVEMFVFIAPDDSATEHDRLLAVEEKLVGELEVPYRVVNVAAGDLGAAAAKKYDIEAWFPGEQNYREITSCSNTTDFQARRLKVRMKTERGNQVVHTLNGTACAVGRTILALIENHQQADGSVVIPKALRPYTGFDLIEP
jgi:seryl-tRNA synthetase